MKTTDRLERLEKLVMVMGANVAVLVDAQSLTAQVSLEDLRDSTMEMMDRLKEMLKDYDQ